MDIQKYLPQLIVVIVGVVIGMMVNKMIQKRRNQADTFEREM